MSPNRLLIHQMMRMLRGWLGQRGISPPRYCHLKYQAKALFLKLQSQRDIRRI